MLDGMKILGYITYVHILEGKKTPGCMYANIYILVCLCIQILLFFNFGDLVSSSNLDSFTLMMDKVGGFT